MRRHGFVRAIVGSTAAWPLALLLGTSAAPAFDSTKIGQWGSLYLDDLSSILAKSALLKQEAPRRLRRRTRNQKTFSASACAFPARGRILVAHASRPTPATSMANIFASTPPFVSSGMAVGPSRQTMIRR